MTRRKFLKGSAIIGASVAVPEILQAASGMKRIQAARFIVS